MKDYEWPEQETFASGFACRFLPRAGRTKFNNVVFGPVVNLLDLTRPTVWAVSVGLLLVSYLLIFNVLPIGFWNSNDGQYIDNTTATIFTFVLYFLLSAFLIGFLTNKGCDALEEQANAYLYNPSPVSAPRTLRK
jgi:hypothetical protein